jgi:hypothetical protein
MSYIFIFKRLKVKAISLYRHQLAPIGLFLEGIMSNEWRYTHICPILSPPHNGRNNALALEQQTFKEKHKARPKLPASPAPTANAESEGAAA